MSILRKWKRKWNSFLKTLGIIVVILEMHSFKSKAETLSFLRGKLATAQVLPLLYFQYEDYLQDPQKYLQNIESQSWGTTALIVRSSAKGEDSVESSMAGFFDSIPNCVGSKNVDLAIRKVGDNYHQHNTKGHILVQPMLNNISSSGVLFTADIDTGASYYIVNYSENSSNDDVTSGKTNDVKTYIHYKNFHQFPNENLKKLIRLAQELETLYSTSKLDIEFAYNDQNELYLFQVRPLLVKNKLDLSENKFDLALLKTKKKIEKYFHQHPNLLGSESILGVMPDWNPAEIIGLKPKRLALSLYKELITDHIWAFQRNNYGYRNLRSHPLMLSIMGVPFIDVRVDFNSFIPSSLSENIASKLSEYYLQKLRQNPHFHDKVEFEIVFSCYHAAIDQELAELQQHAFSSHEVKEIKKSLIGITQKIFNPDTGLCASDIKKANILTQKSQEILQSDLPHIDKIYWLIEYTKRYGTLPFAGVARSAFVAVQTLRSFVTEGILSENDFTKFMLSLNTVSKQLKEDSVRFNKAKMSQKDFLAKYGHLRPGTYDIISKRYDEDFEFYFEHNPDFADSDTQEETFVPTDSCLNKVNQFLKSIELPVTGNEFFNLCKQAIEGRESVKFEFTKTLSDILLLISEWGGKYGFSREDLQHLDIQKVKSLYSELQYDDITDVIQSDIHLNKENYKLTSALKLPSIILKPEDIYSFHLDFEQPNFITLNSITGPITLESNIKNQKLEGSVVFISSADPGYDFLFLKNIGGLVTKFGGANSHMAIRCAELGIPAIIGVGEKRFQEWAQARIIKIDCAHKHVECLS